MAKDYSTAKEEEQMQHGELTPEQLMKIYNLDKNKYMIKKSFNGSSVDAAKKKVKNVQVFQYELYRKDNNGKWVHIKWSKDLFEQQGLNNYALYGENGIVIVKPFSLAKAKGIKDLIDPSAVQTGSFEPGTGGDMSFSMDGIATNPTWFEPVSFSGEDEKIIKNVSFAKLCLLKECYESLGILL